MPSSSAPARKTVHPVHKSSAHRNGHFPPVYRFTLDEYHAMGDAGILTENDRCELIHGIILEKAVIKPPHKKAVRRLLAGITALLGDEYVVDSQGPITLSDSEPEPDISVAIGPEENYDDRNPGPEELELIVEVSDSTLKYDRKAKLELYAKDRLPVYWIVNLEDECIEVYTLPRAGKSPTYRRKTFLKRGSFVPVVIRGKKIGEIAVSDILP
jgi:hypothetical protein